MTNSIDDLKGSDDTEPSKADLGLQSAPNNQTKKEIEEKSKSKKKKGKTNKRKGFTKRERTIATILYIAIVASCIITIIGAIWSVFDLFMESGKFDFFLSLSLGYQIAIVGGFSAGFFFLLIFFVGLSRKGVKNILKIIFRTQEIEEKYQNKTVVKVFAGAIMLSIFAVIIGMIIALIIELFFGSGEDFSLTRIFAAFGSTGPFVLFLGIFLLIIVGLAFFLNWLWYNGYNWLLRLVTDLEKDE